jgi:hypothetical protein
MKRLAILFIGIFIISHWVSSQQIKPSCISSGGGLISNTNAIVTFTIGEPVTGMITNVAAIVTQGFQQSNNTNPVSVSELSSDDIKIKVYPNPTEDLINISLKNDNKETIILELSDLNGKVLMQQKMKDDIVDNQFDLSSYPVGIYLLKISTISGKRSSNFKIQKSK